MEEINKDLEEMDLVLTEYLFLEKTIKEKIQNLNPEDVSAEDFMLFVKRLKGIQEKLCQKG